MITLKRYTVGFEPAVAREIEHRAATLGLTVSGYIRMIVLDRMRQDKKEKHRAFPDQERN
jgi:hypothetical protein